jgi:hypothetical protein
MRNGPKEGRRARHHGIQQGVLRVYSTNPYLVCGSVGLDVAGESVPYMAGWGEDRALEAVTQFAETIDEFARRVEAALTGEQPAAAA